MGFRWDVQMQTDNRLLRLPDVVRQVGLSRSEIYRRIRRGEFPAHLKLGPRASAWRSSEIDRWVEGQGQATKAA